MGRGTKTTEFLKECMADALLKLMRDAPVSKITAQEITDAAGVGRATWFRNFQSKEEAITFKYLLLWDRWFDAHGITGVKLSPDESTKQFFCFNYSIQNILTVIYKQNMQHALYKAYFEIVMPKQSNDILERYKSQFYAYGLVGVLDEWVQRKFQETPEELLLMPSFHDAAES